MKTKQLKKITRGRSDCEVYRSEVWKLVTNVSEKPVSTTYRI
jgi:hypothetical protein